MDLTAMYKELAGKLPSYHEAECYADRGGTLPQRDALYAKASEKFKPISFGGSILRAVTSRLLLGGVDIPEEELALIRWDDLTEAHHNDLCKYGEAYIIVWPNDDTGELMARAIDPQSTCVFYDRETGEPTEAIRAWEDTVAGKKGIRLNHYTDEILARWFSKDGGKTWDPYVDEAEPEAEFFHGLGVLPIFHTHLKGSRPVHYESYGAQDMLLRLCVAYSSSIDLLGWPQIYALYELGSASTTSELGAFMDADELPPSETDLDEVSKLKRSPGSIWALHAKQLGQLQPADTRQLIEGVDKFTKLVSSLTGIPERYFTPPGGQQPSGDSQRAADADFQQLISSIQRKLSATYERVLQLVLELPKAPDITWAPAEIAQDADFWATTLRKQEAGVPVEQTLREAGYSQADVDVFMQEQGDDAAMLRRVQILNVIGDAVGKLAAASSTGAINPARVDQLVEAIFGQIATGG